MRDKTPHGVSTFAESPTSEPEKRDLAQLKQRLVELWNSQEIERDINLDEIVASLPLRQGMASFVPEGSRILDLACGTTANARWLSPLGRYFGVDISLGFLRLSRRLTPALALACADAESLPFRDCTFDAAALTFALEHSVNPVGILREITRVVRPKGRIILLGPSWDLPFWYPNALQSRSERPGWLLGYTLHRLSGQLRGWLLGQLPFLVINDPDALARPFVHDADAVYLVWSYEVIRQMKRWGCKLIHAEVDNRLLGPQPIVRLFKRFLFLLPPYRLAGSTVLMVFEKC